VIVNTFAMLGAQRLKSLGSITSDLAFQNKILQPNYFFIFNHLAARRDKLRFARGS
jgi:hypothetical protein